MVEEDFSKAEIFITYLCVISASASMKFLRIWISTIVRTHLPAFAYRNWMLRSRELKTKELNEYFQRLSMLKAVDDNWVEQVDYLQQSDGQW